MDKPIVLEDLLTMTGKKAAGTPPPSMLYFGHADSWLRTSGCRAVVLSVEVKEITPSVEGTRPTLKIQTSVCIGGPFFDVAEYDTVGDKSLVLRRETGGGVSNQLFAFVRWAIDDTDVPADTVWSVCFRITAQLEPV
jgi:hypothetical protein